MGRGGQVAAPSVQCEFDRGLRDSRELRSFRCCRLELEQIVFDIYPDRRTSLESGIENSLRERILDQILNNPAQRACAVGVVVSTLAQEVHRRFGDFELDLLLGKLLAHTSKL